MSSTASSQDWCDLVETMATQLIALSTDQELRTELIDRIGAIDADATMFELRGLAMVVRAGLLKQQPERERLGWFTKDFVIPTLVGLTVAVGAPMILARVQGPIDTAKNVCEVTINLDGSLTSATVDAPTVTGGVDAVLEDATSQANEFPPGDERYPYRLRGEQHPAGAITADPPGSTSAPITEETHGRDVEERYGRDVQGYERDIEKRSAPRGPEGPTPPTTDSMRPHGPSEARPRPDGSPPAKWDESTFD